MDQIQRIAKEDYEIIESGRSADAQLFWKNRSEEELNKQHIISPMDKNEARNRVTKYKYQEQSVVKFDDFLNESVDFQDTKDWMTNEIQTKKGFVKMKRMKEKYIGFLDRMEEFSEENQTIPKKELTQIKNAFDKLCSAYYYDPKKKADQELMYDKLGVKFWDYDGPLRFIAMYGVASAVKLMKEINVKLKPAEQEFVDNYFQNLHHWTEIHNRLEYIRQILNPTKEEKDRRKNEDIKGKLNPKIRTAIDEIAENFRKVIEKNEHTNCKKSIERYLETYGEVITYEQMTEDEYTPSIIHKVYINEKKIIKNNYDITLIKNWKSFIKKYALEYSHDAILSFQYKMYDKIGGMISDINKDFEVDVTGRGMRNNNIHFTFDDGSKFSIRNKIVNNLNQYNTFYYTYPTTFHDAYLPDGKKIPSPNEFNVKKEFNDYYDNKVR
jgi:hypothetical protein